MEDKHPELTEQRFAMKWHDIGFEKGKNQARAEVIEEIKTELLGTTSWGAYGEDFELSLTKGQLFKYLNKLERGAE